MNIFSYCADISKQYFVLDYIFDEWTIGENYIYIVSLSSALLGGFLLLLVQKPKRVKFFFPVFGRCEKSNN